MHQQITLIFKKWNYLQTIYLEIIYVYPFNCAQTNNSCKIKLFKHLTM